MRIIKVIIAAGMGTFFMIISVGTFLALLEEYFHNTLIIADAFDPMIFFVGCCVVSFEEIIRTISGKKWVIIPMLYMYLVMFLSGLTVGAFARSALGMGSNYLLSGVALALVTSFIAAIGFEINGRKQFDPVKTEDDPARFMDHSSDRFRAEAEEEIVRTRGINAVNEEKLGICSCNYIAYLYVWLMKRGALVELGDNSHSVQAEEIMSESCDPAEYLYRRKDGKLARKDVSYLMRPFLDLYYEREAGDKVRECSYGTDYDEIISENGKRHIREFSWKLCHAMEERLDRRYDEYCRKLSGTAK